METVHYLLKIGAKYDRRTGNWILRLSSGDTLNIPKPAIEGGYFQGGYRNPLDLARLKEIITEAEAMGDRHSKDIPGRGQWGRIEVEK